MMTFEEIQRRYWNLIYQRCLYALFFDKKLALEITQDVFVTLWRSWPLNPEVKIEGWLRKTAKHKISRVQKKRTRDKLILSPNQEILSTYAQERDIVDQITDDKVAENMDLYVQQIYARLKPDEIVLAQAKRVGEPYREIAARMGTTETAVAMRMSRLKRKVKRMIDEIVEGIL